jgi:hypothetical protein
MAHDSSQATPLTRSPERDPKVRPTRPMNEKYVTRRLTRTNRNGTRKDPAGGLHYLPTDLPTYLTTYLPTYLPTYVRTYVPGDTNIHWVYTSLRYQPSVGRSCATDESCLRTRKTKK